MPATLGLLLFLAPVPAADVTLLIQTPKAPRFADTTKDEARALLRDSVEKVLQFRMERLGYRVNFLPEKLLEAEPAKGNLGNLEGNPDVTVIRILDWSHKNRSNEDIINNPNAPKSETKATFGVWRIVNGQITGSRQLETKVGGPYFGTTDKKSMQGSPDAKALAIRLVNRQRSETIGAAVWEGIKDDYPTVP